MDKAYCILTIAAAMWKWEISLLLSFTIGSVLFHRLPRGMLYCFHSSSRARRQSLIVLMLTPSSTFPYFLPPFPPSFSLPFFLSSQWLASSWQAFVLRHADIEMLIQHQYNWNDIDWVTAAKYDCAYVRFGVSTAKFTLMEAFTGSDADVVFLGSRCCSPGWTTTAGPSLDHHSFCVCEMHANMFGHKFKTKKKKSSFTLFWCFLDLVLNCCCCWIWHIRASGCDL